MLKFALLIPAVALLAFGTEGVYNALQSRTETTVTCAQLRQTKPPSLKLRVTGCDIDYKGGAYRESGGSIEELFLPARPSGAPVNLPAPLVVATRVPNALAVAQPLVKSGAPAGRSVQTMQQAAVAAGISEEIRGLVRAGFIERLASRQVLSGLSTPLAADVLLLDLNGSPSFAWPISLIVLGLATLGMLGHLVRRTPSPPVAVVPEIGDRESVLERLMPYAAKVAEAADPPPEAVETAETPARSPAPAPTPPPPAQPIPVVTAPVKATVPLEGRRRWKPRFGWNCRSSGIAGSGRSSGGSGLTGRRQPRSIAASHAAEARFVRGTGGHRDGAAAGDQGRRHRAPS